MSAAPIAIGFLLPHFRVGGAERVVLNWLRHLDRDRFRPALFLMHGDGGLIPHLPADIHPRLLGATRAYRLARPIARALADEGVAVAYSATNAMNLALLAARCPPGVARIISEHSSPAAYLAEAKLPALRRAAMRRFYPRADAIAVPTDAIGLELAATLARPIRLVTLANPVVDGAAPVGHRPPGAVPHVVSAGRLVPAKGYDVLIAAIARIVAAGVALHVTICGEGPLRSAFAARIEQAGLANIVRLVGHSDRLGDVLAGADLFVSSSRREGFGNVIVEAMAAGTPVLATRTGGAETLIRDGINGFLVPMDDAAALAAAMTALLADPDRRNAVCAAARETAARYDAAASTRAFETLVAAVVTRRAADA